MFLSILRVNGFVRACCRCWVLPTVGLTSSRAVLANARMTVTDVRGRLVLMGAPVVHHSFGNDTIAASVEEDSLSMQESQAIAPCLHTAEV